jgi:hypothetical protein
LLLALLPRRFDGVSERRLPLSTIKSSACVALPARDSRGAIPCLLAGVFDT